MTAGPDVPVLLSADDHHRLSEIGQRRQMKAEAAAEIAAQMRLSRNPLLRPYRQQWHLMQASIGEATLQHRLSQSQ